MWKISIFNKDGSNKLFFWSKAVFLWALEYQAQFFEKMLLFFAHFRPFWAIFCQKWPKKSQKWAKKYFFQKNWAWSSRAHRNTAFDQKLAYLNHFCGRRYIFLDFEKYSIFVKNPNFSHFRPNFRPKFRFPNKFLDFFQRNH